ncbi:cytochrome C [Alteromonadaceae bacterium M269]|nr:cytochrome C [Alteromonadaceae bacterium M269]
MKKLILGAALGLTALTSTVLAHDAFSSYINSKGEMVLPENYQTEMSHMGSFLVPSGGAAGFHHVYTQPETIEAFKATGEFPDGAVIIKEIRGTEKADYTTGAGVSSATGIAQVFMMIKDTKGRFKGNKLWGEGWAWSLHKPGSNKNVATDYKVDCLGCHEPVRSQDFIYTQAYPILEAGGSSKTSNAPAGSMSSGN